MYKITTLCADAVWAPGLVLVWGESVHTTGAPGEDIPLVGWSVVHRGLV